MKHTFFALLAVAACAASAFAQTSPAPASSGSLTKEERERAVAYLKETQKDFLAAVEGVSDAQWKFKAAPDRWSLAETAEHIATAEDFIWARVNEIMKAPANPERSSETQGRDKIIYDKIPDRSRKAQAPEALKPTGKFATREELVWRQGDKGDAHARNGTQVFNRCGHRASCQVPRGGPAASRQAESPPAAQVKTCVPKFSCRHTSIYFVKSAYL